MPSWVDSVTSSTSGTRGTRGGSSSSTLHAGGAKLLLGQVDGVVMLLGVTLLPLLEVRPSTNILQTLLGIPHRDHLQGLMRDTCGSYLLLN